jgi:hypothetical protein
MDGGVDRGISAEEIGVAGECVVRLAVDQETDTGDLWQSGVESPDDRLQGEGFDLNA